MPFTPFHMGAVMPIKALVPGRISVIAFGMAQVLMDIEPGIGMLTGAATLHGPSHTWIGALVIACVARWMAPRVEKPLLRRWNAEVRHYRLDRLQQLDPASSASSWAGALFGTLSHIALDSMMHADMHPLAPLSSVNPMMDWVGHDAIYRWCAIASTLGTVAWLAVQWLSCRQAGIARGDGPGDST